MADRQRDSLCSTTALPGNATPLPKVQNLSQREMAQLWEAPISGRTMSRALKKVGFTRKK
jgi:hypothetical protein